MTTTESRADSHKISSESSQTAEQAGYTSQFHHYRAPDRQNYCLVREVRVATAHRGGVDTRKGCLVSCFCRLGLSTSYTSVFTLRKSSGPILRILLCTFPYSQRTSRRFTFKQPGKTMHAAMVTEDGVNNG